MENNRQDDLDMLTLFGSIRLAIRRIFVSLGNVVRTSIRNGITISIFMAIGVALFLGLYFLSKPYYSSELLINHTRLDNDYCREMVENLNSIIDSKSKNKVLARKLGHSIELAEMVKSIEYGVVNENVSKRFADSTYVFLPFKVEVDVYDKSVLDSLQVSILNYLENNEYALRRKAIDVQHFALLETRLKRELTELDSLKRIVASGIVPRASGQGIILGEPIDPVMIYKRGSELYEKLLFVKRRQELINSFEVAVGFSQSAKRASPGKLVYIGLGLLIGYLMGFAYVKANRR